MSENRKKKSVSFELNPQTKILHTWLYAHQQARKGTWHIDAVDRIRFQRRIEQTKNILDPILLIHIRNVSSFDTKC